MNREVQDSVLENSFLAQYDREIDVEYRGEVYRVRDNGAVYRQQRPNQRKRPLDSRWTFGRADSWTGYMHIGSEVVHRIVTTAFFGSQPSEKHVVDHIDTNRRNNRAENLRWVTRLENVVKNPITAKRLIELYGSIEHFLADPSHPRKRALPANYEWMRTVSQEEAEHCRKRLLAWAKSDMPSKGGTLGDWIFGPRVDREEDETVSLVRSKTLGAVQLNWRVPAEFPLSPHPGREMPLEEYFDGLKVGIVFCVSRFGQTKVVRTALSSDGMALFVLGASGEQAVKQWSLAKVTYEDNCLVHESRGTFFTREGAEKQFALSLGLLWEGGATIDDYS